MKALMMLTVMLSTAAGAQQPNPNQYLKDPVPHPAPSHPAFHTFDDAMATKPVLEIENGCKKYECFIVFNDASGNEIVRISQRTGNVTIAHPERQDEAARQFWLALTRTFGQLHCSPP